MGVCGCDYVIQVALIDYCIIMSLSKILDAWVFMVNVHVRTFTVPDNAATSTFRSDASDAKAVFNSITSDWITAVHHSSLISITTCHRALQRCMDYSQAF